jgi:transposase-like protein
MVQSSKELEAQMVQLTAQLEKARKLEAAGVRRTKRTFTVEQKLAAVGRIAAGEQACNVARELDIDDSVISTWKLRAFAAMADQRGKK